ANDSLGGGFLARINMDLRETRHWAYGAYGSFSRAQHAVFYSVSAPVQADRTGESIAAIRGDVAAFVTDKGITSEEFDRTIAGSIRELSGSYESSAAVLGAMAANDLYRRPDDYQARLPEKYRALTRAQLDAAARAALDPKRFIWVVVGDAAKVRPQLDSIGLPVEVIPAVSVADPR
ncbi:MAG: insulinase family protein, partial [Sphingomonas sp.]